MNEPQDPQVRALDARSLRGLAHPLRMQLLDALRFGGPATASQLAGKLGESSGATSYHLRQLATHGFVEDAPERGKGRERWWKAVHKGLSFDDALLTDTDPAVRGAADMYLHEVATAQTQELSTWLGTRSSWPEEWNRVWDMSSATLRLTPELTRELIERMHALIDTFRDRAAAEDDTDAAQVRLHTHAFPMATDAGGGGVRDDLDPATTPTSAPDPTPNPHPTPDPDLTPTPAPDPAPDLPKD